MCGVFSRILLLISLSCLCTFAAEILNEDNSVHHLPTVGISILVRNKAYSLPFFLSCLFYLNYPKDRIYIWIHSDYNADRGDEILETWAQAYSRDYRGIYVTTNKTTGPRHADEHWPTHWSAKRMAHVIALRQKALNFARDHWADYLFMVDADVFLTNPDTLNILVEKELTVAAPMLVSDGKYSNFWGGMKDYYYLRTEEYASILAFEKPGCHTVPMVHSAVLINLRHMATQGLTYDKRWLDLYDGPVDDIIIFASSAERHGISLQICNDHFYGYIQVPLSERQDYEEDQNQLINIKMEALGRGQPLPLDHHLEMYVHYPMPWKYGLDEMFMINLPRRPERRALMEQSFKELGLLVHTIPAVDGKEIDFRKLSELKIRLMKEFRDPFSHRPMKAGEVGCFLSHFRLWKEIIRRKMKWALILEDDLRFVPFFRQKFSQLLDELETMDWDLVYLGRKILENAEEEFVSPLLVRPKYTYWTIGYLLTENGAQKLVNAKPLSNMLPVDEFLPIMFDEHPNSTWKEKFPKRDLKAFAASPVLIYPTHYTGEEGYISDTEDSMIRPDPIEHGGEL